METLKYYGIYMAYPLRMSWHPDPLAKSDGSQKAWCLGAKFGQWAE
jgi:hypothetical protein